MVCPLSFDRILLQSTMVYFHGSDWEITEIRDQDGLKKLGSNGSALGQY
jgi:hypothetical protein